MKHVTLDEVGFKQNFGKMLNSLILSKGLTVNKVATDTGIDGKSLRSYIKGESVPTAISIYKLAAYLEVTADFLIFGCNPNSSFSPTTIANLGAVVKDCKLCYDRQASDDDTLVLRVEDRILSMILKELLLCKGAADYDAVVNKLVMLFGDVKGYHGELVDYRMYRNLVRQEFLYQNIDKEDITYNADGSESLNWFDHDELILRSEQWDQMDESEHEAWWELYSAGMYEEAEEVVTNRKVQASPEAEED